MEGLRGGNGATGTPEQRLEAGICSMVEQTIVPGPVAVNYEVAFIR
jgi:hypothetical protein